jgi:Domain of unknown function (DUF4303)
MPHEEHATLWKWLAAPRTELITAVADGIQKHVAKLRAAGREFYGYALIPGEFCNIGEICAVTNAESEIKVTPSDKEYYYYRFGVGEWEQWDYEGEFVEANALIQAERGYFNSVHTRSATECIMDELEIAHAKLLFNSIVSGLDLEKQNGTFGNSEHFLLVWLAQDENIIVRESIRRLNSADVFKLCMIHCSYDTWVAD